MNHWNELVTNAYLGTQRRGIDLSPLPGKLGGLVASLSGQGKDPEHALLGAAAALSLGRRAGRIQPGYPALAEMQPAPDDNRPRPGPAVCANIGELINGKYKAAQNEWLALMIKTGRRMPEEHLPALLELGKQNADVQEALAHTIGARGRWLAAQNPDWAYILDTKIETTWKTGSRQARCILLGRLRARDAVQARELLESTWKDDPPDDRHDFLWALRIGLSLADEPFLEHVLDDRSEKVSRRAAWLLSNLPESDLVRRVTARALPLLYIDESHPFPTPRFLSARAGPVKRLAVTLPERCDPAMVRDGIEAQRRRFSFGGGVGDKGWWVQQMIGMIPPIRWCEKFGLSPAELIAMAARSEWRSVIIGGWEVATQLHKDGDWAAVLLDHGSGRPEFPLSPSPLRGLINAMLPASREAYAMKVFARARYPLALDRSGLTLLDGCGHQWSSDFSLVVLGELARAIVHKESQGVWTRRRAPSASNDIAATLWGNVEFLALHVDPALADVAGEMLVPAAAGNPPWEKAVSLFLDMLRFRHNMRKEMVG